MKKGVEHGIRKDSGGVRKEEQKEWTGWYRKKRYWTRWRVTVPRIRVTCVRRVSAVQCSGR